MNKWKFRSVVLIAALFATYSVNAAQLKKVTLFSGPLVDWDAIWMADAKGLFKAEGLDVTIKVFPSGSTALQTFQTGQGDIVGVGDLPSVRYWNSSGKNFRLINVISRSTQMFLTALKGIKKPQDLEGKTVATRVGSTGSWFASVYLSKNHIPADKVKIINLDTSAMPTALCGKEISGFFIWEPFNSRAQQICPDTVYQMSSADGYVAAYSVIGARPKWLNSPEGSDIAIRFLRALLKGRAIAMKDFASDAAYGEQHFGYKHEDIAKAWKVVDRSEAFDKKFYSDYCSLSQWMQSQKMIKQPLTFSDFLWTKGLKTIAPDRVDQAPAHC